MFGYFCDTNLNYILKNHRKKIGVLGGGQLGKMLLSPSNQLDLNIEFLDKNLNFPVGQISSQFKCGDFGAYQDVVDFGKDKDIITIEIEKVNVDALETLEKMGKLICPAPAALRIIQDKGLQKQFYLDHNIPTTDFSLYDTADGILVAIEKGELTYPFVQKARKDGYDGKGVAVINSENDLERLLKVPSLVEEKADIKKEIAVIAAKNPSGEVKCFPVVDMDFNHSANLVEYLYCPSRVPESIQKEALALAKKLITSFDVNGLLAVEFFYTNSDQLLVNEVAPRPHNSGHHTIDSSFTSQFEQHLRAILDLPLGSCKIKTPAVMVNLLGKPPYSGPAKYQGLEKCLAKTGVNIHLYGKKETRPHRKMGHATIISEQIEDAYKIAKFVRENLEIIS